MALELPEARSIMRNPTQTELRDRVARMPNAAKTEFGSYSVTTSVTARSAGSTFVVTDDPSRTQKQTMSRADYRREADRQDAYVAEADMILIEGYIGAEDSPVRVPARVLVERANANIAAMQQQLYYPKDADWREEDAFTVIDTPSLSAPGWPGERLVTVDTDAWVTRVLGIDYFGESKMGGLRMWNEWVHEAGGLAMHAGAKVIPTETQDMVALIVGLSGTGKTTTTFTRQNDSLPVQDDFVALMPGGRVYATEDGCFAKTHGLDPKQEPVVHDALTRPTAWLENVAVSPDGTVDFFESSHTANGRGTFEFAEIPHYDPRRLGRADCLLILNRNDTVVPAVAKMASKEQAVAYFMLGETKGTSAGGAAEAGRSLRVPGTNPFFLRPDEQQGHRLATLLDSMDYDFQVFVLSTGRVGGAEGAEGSKKVSINHTSAIVRAIAEGRVRWQADPDFGYLVASDVPGVEDLELLQPRVLYERQGRGSEYSRLVRDLKAARRENLASHPGLGKTVVDAL